MTIDTFLRNQTIVRRGQHSISRKFYAQLFFYFKLYSTFVE